MVGKRSMMVAQRTLALSSSGIRPITCSTCSVGKRPQRWKCSWARASELLAGREGREPTGPRREERLGEGGGVSSLGGEGGAPQMEEEGVMLVPSRGEKYRYFQVSELEKGSEESALLTAEKPLLSWVSEVELSRCMGEWVAGASLGSSRGGGLIPRGWRRVGAVLRGWCEPHCRMESGAEAFLVTFWWQKSSWGAG